MTARLWPVKGELYTALRASAMNRFFLDSAGTLSPSWPLRSGCRWPRLLMGRDAIRPSKRTQQPSEEKDHHHPRCFQSSEWPLAAAGNDRRTPSRRRWLRLCCPQERRLLFWRTVRPWQLLSQQCPPLGDQQSPLDPRQGCEHGQCAHWEMGQWNGGPGGGRGSFAVGDWRVWKYPLSEWQWLWEVQAREVQWWRVD